MNDLLEAVAPFVTGLQETLSGRQGANPQVPLAQEFRVEENGDPAMGLQVGHREPFFLIRNESMETSMLNRIRKLERENSVFLLEQAKGAYWEEVKSTLNNSGSQKEYCRLLCFENRDLQIRERKHECFFLFQEILSRNRALRGDAANPTEDFMDFFSEKREVLDKNPEWGPVEKDIKEIEFVEQVKLDLAARGHESPYIKQILGLG